jgi:hypothetical protein
LIYAVTPDAGQVIVALSGELDVISPWTLL